MRCLLLGAALALNLIPVLRGQTALGVSLLRFTRWGLEAEEALQVVLIEVDRLDRVLRADRGDVKLEKGLAIALRVGTGCKTLVVHEEICLIRSGEKIIFPWALRSLRDLLSVLEELLILLFQSDSISENIDGFLALVFDLIILYLSFDLAVLFIACLPV